jgi:hypothetical protein
MSYIVGIYKIINPKKLRKQFHRRSCFPGAIGSQYVKKKIQITRLVYRNDELMHQM